MQLVFPVNPECSSPEVAQNRAIEVVRAFVGIVRDLVEKPRSVLLCWLWKRLSSTLRRKRARGKAATPRESWLENFSRSDRPMYVCLTRNSFHRWGRQRIRLRFHRLTLIFLSASELTNETAIERVEVPLCPRRRAGSSCVCSRAGE